MSDVPSFESGQPLRAEDLNKIVDMLVGRISCGEGLQVHHFKGQFGISLDEAFRPQASLQQLVVKSVGADHLVCRTLDATGTEGTSDVYVLKPWLLRRTPFDGLSVNGVSYSYSTNSYRTAGGEEEQEITQEYYADCVIYAMDIDVSVDVGGGIYCAAVDVNVDGRAWCKVAEEE